MSLETKNTVVYINEFGKDITIRCNFCQTETRCVYLGEYVTREQIDLLESGEQNLNECTCYSSCSEEKLQGILRDFEVFRRILDGSLSSSRIYIKVPEKLRKMVENILLSLYEISQYESILILDSIEEFLKYDDPSELIVTFIEPGKTILKYDLNMTFQTALWLEYWVERIYSSENCIGYFD